VKFSVEDRTRFSRELVYTTHRDRFVEIAPTLDEVASVRRLSSSRDAKGVVVQRHDWQGSSAALPVFLRPMVPEGLLRWTDEVVWDPAAWTATWTITLPGLGPVADIRGVNRYTQLRHGCKIVLDGNVAFHAEHIPQMKLPPGTAKIIERFVVALVVPLLKKSGKAVIATLESEHPQ